MKRHLKCDIQKECFLGEGKALRGRELRTTDYLETKRSADLDRTEVWQLGEKVFLCSMW